MFVSDLTLASIVPGKPVDVSSAELLPASPESLVGGVRKPDAPHHVSRDAPDRGEREPSAG